MYMNKEWKTITKLKLEEHFNNGLWYEEIATLYEVSARTVREKTSKFGIVLERKNKKKEVVKKICIKCGKEYVTSKNEGYCSARCLVSLQSLEAFKDVPQEATTDLGNQILKLRRLGYTYSKIAKEIGCAKSTVSWHCNNTTKEKHKEYIEKVKEENPWVLLLSKHLDTFKHRNRGIGRISMCLDWNKKFRSSVSRFRRRNNMNPENNYTYKEALEHLGGIQTKCYLTGIPINIETDDYCLDHIIPVDKGGNNELSNMGITTPSANASKTNLTLDEFLAQSKLILQNFGYTIIGPE